MKNVAPNMIEFGPFENIEDARKSANDHAKAHELPGTIFTRNSNGVTEPSGHFYSLFFNHPR